MLILERCRTVQNLWIRKILQHEYLAEKNCLDTAAANDPSRIWAISYLTPYRCKKRNSEARDRFALALELEPLLVPRGLLLRLLLGGLRRGGALGGRFFFFGLC